MVVCSFLIHPRAWFTLHTFGISTTFVRQLHLATTNYILPGCKSIIPMFFRKRFRFIIYTIIANEAAVGAQVPLKPTYPKYRFIHHVRNQKITECQRMATDTPCKRSCKLICLHIVLSFERPQRQHS